MKAEGKKRKTLKRKHLRDSNFLIYFLSFTLCARHAQTTSKAEIENGRLRDGFEKNIFQRRHVGRYFSSIMTSNNACRSKLNSSRNETIPAIKGHVHNAIGRVTCGIVCDPACAPGDAEETTGIRLVVEISQRATGSRPRRVAIEW